MVTVCISCASNTTGTNVNTYLGVREMIVTTSIKYCWLIIILFCFSMKSNAKKEMLINRMFFADDRPFCDLPYYEFSTRKNLTNACNISLK
jgi:hypothetical protein